MSFFKFAQADTGTDFTESTLESTSQDFTTNIDVSGVDPAQVEQTAGIFAGIGIGLAIIYVVLLVLLYVCLAKIYMKANRKWWEAVIPIYSSYVWLKIVGRPWWWLLLMLVPFVNIVIAIIVLVDTAKAFGKGGGTAVLLLFFPYVMYPLMAFSKDYRYIGPVAAPGFTPGSSTDINNSGQSPAAASSVAAGFAQPMNTPQATQPQANTPNAGVASESPNPAPPPQDPRPPLAG